MNVASLNNLGLKPAAPKAAGQKASPSKEKSSFESVLGETQTSSKENPRENASPKQDTVNAKAQPSEPSNGPVGNLKNENEPAENQQPSVEATETPESMPNSTGAPTLAGPNMGDRYLAGPVNPALANIMVGQSPATPQDDAANSLTRRVVWNDFLRKMNDLGVSADDVMRAFASLSPEELAKPPTQTVDKVVLALGLDGQQAAMARQYFQDLIAKTKSHSFGEELSASHKQISLTLMSQREMQRKSLQQSLESMDRNFFMPRPFNQPQEPQGIDGKQAGLIAPDAMGQDLSPAMESNPSETPYAMAGLAGMTPQAGVPSAAVPSAPGGAQALSEGGGRAADLNKLVGQMQAPGAGDNRAMDQMVRNLSTRQMRHSAMAQAPLNADPAATAAASTPGVAAPTAAAQPATFAGLNGIMGGGSSHKDSSGDDSGDDATDTMGMNSALAADNRAASNQNVKGDFQAQLAKAAPGQPQTMGVPDLVQQAHIMVRDGGGDMKVTLHPEGLGEVAMRVSVNDGKVNVQMITQSDEAKRLIEHQIGDLKTGLTQNHLQVDSIKVDTATNLGKQLEQQYHDAQRQQAQMNLEQFRQDQQGWRRSFFETGSVNPYRGQAEAPRDVRNPAAVAASARNSNSRRLDLVA